MHAGLSAIEVGREIAKHREHTEASTGWSVLRVCFSPFESRNPCVFPHRVPDPIPADRARPATWAKSEPLRVSSLAPKLPSLGYAWDEKQWWL